MIKKPLLYLTFFGIIATSIEEVAAPPKVPSEAKRAGKRAGKWRRRCRDCMDD